MIFGGGGAAKSRILQGYLNGFTFLEEKSGCNPSTTSGKNAFTLAEVLITLGIIGIVASMTLPTLINNQRNKALQTALKKAYSRHSEAFMLVKDEMGVDNLRTEFATYDEDNKVYARSE